MPETVDFDALRDIAGISVALAGFIGIVLALQHRDVAFMSLVLDSAAPIQTTLNSGKHTNPTGDHSAVVPGRRCKTGRWSGLSTRVRVRDLLLGVVMDGRSLGLLVRDDPIRQPSNRY